MAIRHRSADPATCVSSALPCPARQASKQATWKHVKAKAKPSRSCLSRPPHVANGAKHNADPPEILCESCLQPKLPILSILRSRARILAPRHPTSAHYHRDLPSWALRPSPPPPFQPSPFVCAARQHEAAEIGAHPPFMYVLPIPARLYPYLVQGLRSARAEGASGGGSAVAAAGVACRAIDASCTAHLMPRAASSQLHVPCLWEDFCLVTANIVVSTSCWLYTVHFII